MNEKELVPKTRTNFVQVKCPSCGNLQAVFSAPCTKVKCLACEKNLLIPRSSKGEFAVKPLKTLDKITEKQFKLTRWNRRKFIAKKIEAEKEVKSKVVKESEGLRREAMEKGKEMEGEFGKERKEVEEEAMRERRK